MKLRHIKYIGALCLMLLGASCDKYIDVVPDNIAVIEDAFETRQSAERFLSTLYSYLPQFATINNPALAAGDEIAVNPNVSRNWAATVIARGGQSVVGPRLGYWGNDGSVRNLFIALRDCNIFLDNIDKPFDLEEFEKNRWIAEAKFLKAYYHFYLMRMYGPIPIVRENIEVSSGVDAVRVHRDPVDDVVNYIVELLDEAIPQLPTVIENRGLELGRVTAPIAAAIKARALVTAASPLFNGNSDYSNFTGPDGEQLINSTPDDAKWARAAEACKEAIDLAHAAGHTLYEFTGAPADWSDTTVTKLSIRGSVTDRWNDEVIWGSSNSVIGGGLQSWAQAKIAPGLTAENRESTQSWWSPPLRIAEMFYTENGVPLDEDTNYDFAGRFDVTTADDAHQHYVRPGFETARLNLNREPRFYASLGFDGGIWFGHGQNSDDNAFIVEGKKGERAGRQDANRWSLSGYWAKKLVYYENIQVTSGFGYTSRAYPFPVVRLSDLYLLYAEALNESNGPASAYEWIDLIRSRAGLDGVVQSWANASNNPSKPSTKEGLREIIQGERMIELVFEGQRFWDLRRWKRAHEFLNSDIRAWNIEGETTSDYYNVISVGSYKFLNRDYLWPLAETDIIANSNLVQNPGW
ncbi:RagB/SusD family nutrient uptake outer membrane protein [Fulvivirgaceae bacterium BMA10]|uniref:RagB/SusD family nutrient uptake outer membrane protein n=1 Tax=Splendidivirga corallicola TaxID=3051826 RepID=A0ABT8KN94_9BACT|nr:RagB/SusD family nutrient uptake outer membrane protein [Fulvivirgaceae bacterium BMA10]